ncbi:MAG: serine/threonine-protein phosphatase [Clostridiaceae bacterium]|nr:serine/threonine-protein phosphatase [Clostridiaceae bacterium]
MGELQPLIGWLAMLAGALLLAGSGLMLLTAARRHKHAAQPVSSANPWRYLYPLCQARQHLGHRHEQQDFVLIPFQSDAHEWVRRHGCLSVLSDGMGGMDSGALTSRQCAQSLFGAYANAPEIADPAAFFRETILSIDRRIASLTGQDGQALRAGTTVTVVLIRGTTLFWASVGDSRIYLWHQQQLTQLSQDHHYLTTLLEQVARDQITLDEALDDPRKDALSRYVGMGKLEAIDTGVLEHALEPDDLVVLCSDGLTRALDDDELREVIRNTQIRGLLADRLIETAIQKDYLVHDNISVVVVSAGA